MTKKYTTLIMRLVTVLTITMLSTLHPVSLSAFPVETYATESNLKDGLWIKVSVSQSGIHFISASTLRQWGFNDPSKVHVYGYGGKRIDDKLALDNYIDDVPLLQSVNTAQGIYFHAQGPTSWKTILSDKLIPQSNPFSDLGYYFLSDKETSARTIEKSGTAVAGEDYIDYFIATTHHEKDLVSPGETGHFLVGEDFKYDTSQSFSFSLPGKTSQSVWMQCVFFSKTLSSPGYLSFTANGGEVKLSGNNFVPTTTNASYYHGTKATFRSSFDLEGEKLELGLNFRCSATIHAANLDYIVINYTRKAQLTNGSLYMTTPSQSMRVYDATDATHVWDVTDALNITELNTLHENNSVVWSNSNQGKRTYAVWNENGSFPSPVYVGRVSNQNLHAEPTPDMVIFTIGKWASQARRIAQLHENSSDSLKVLVVDQNAVFNEFSSGVPDVSAFRKMLKMFYDRGNDNGHSLKYALMFGRTTYDSRHKTTTIKNQGYPTMPSWMTDDGLNDNSSYQTDDFVAFLGDNSGGSVDSGNDKLSIAVGRIPVRTTEEAKSAVDKLYKYVNNSVHSEWKNHVLLIADDNDNGVHMTQTNSMYNLFIQSNGGKELFYDKVYTDAYNIVNNRYPDAHNLMMQYLEAGTVWWNYIGHANTTSWTHEMLLSWEDINSLYYKNLPLLYAATCEFMRWDASATSGAEIMFHNPYGGIIAAISANRPVYIANNGIMSNNIAKIAFSRDAKGNTLPIGVILQQAKNAFNQSDNNKLRYALMGDPAMRLAIPTPRATLESINGAAVNLDDQVTLQARETAILKGSIYDPSGNKMTTFNGTISATMYDAEKSTTTKGNGDQGKSVIFEEQGGKLYAGRDSVINGEFSLKVAMPSEIANNFRQAALNMYATANDGTEAAGCNRDFYVYGYSENAANDDQPPVIESMYLNHESFCDGDMVNESPMLIARISDNMSINLSSAGIGHQMLLTLDGSESYSNVSQFYTPDANGQASGTINYPLDGLQDGAHTLRLRVWDTSGNSAESSISLNVKNGLTPVIFDIYSDANPAYTEANFYVSHNRPDAILTVTLTIYDLMGRTQWSTTSTGRSDMFQSFPITWDLCDLAGRRVNRGIYLYKVAISTDGEQFESQTKKIAVAAQK